MVTSGLVEYVLSVMQLHTAKSTCFVVQQLRNFFPPAVNCANVSHHRCALEAEVNTTKITPKTSTHYTEDTRNLCVEMNLIQDKAS
jgi:hypothetical protein